jgi:hypothetical protein
VIDTYEVDGAHDFSSRTTFRARGFGDTVVGGKLNLWGNEGGDEPGYTALAIQPQFKLPTARDGIGNGRFEFSIEAPFLANLPTGIHLGLQAGISQQRNSTNTAYVTGFPASVSLDRVVFANIDVYLEFACDLTTEKHVTAPQTIDMGATYPLTKNIVLDAGINIGLNRASNNFEVLTGISFRH